jgi:hypothetical protein
MAPRANRISGPAAIRYLLTASTHYQRVVQDAVATIQDVITEGMPPGSEVEYAQLLLALTEAERALSWVAERSRVLLGEQEERT